MDGQVDNGRQRGAGRYTHREIDGLINNRFLSLVGTIGCSEDPRYLDIYTTDLCLLNCVF